MTRREMNNIIETKILTTSTTLAICMVGWVKPEKQQQILLNDLMSNGHKRYINTTDWQTIENINNLQQNSTHISADWSILCLVVYQAEFHTDIIARLKVM